MKDNIMFEFEVDHQSFSASELPNSILTRFAETHSRLRAFSLMPWEEHCTECGMPQCYQTCDLYAPRKDGKCRRFHYGFGYLAVVPSALGYVSKVSFKRWGVLMAYANANLRSNERARQLVTLVAAVDRLIALVPDAGLTIRGRSGISSRLMRRFKQYLVHSGLFVESESLPDCFFIEVFNPGLGTVDLSLVIRDADGALRERPFQELLKVLPGYNRLRIPFSDISKHIDLNRQFHITLNPNLLTAEDEGLTLYFGVVSFVSEFQISEDRVNVEDYEPSVMDCAKHVKVVAWDLDNTLWHGVLVEDGESKLRLRAGILDVIRELDRRGIVNSVVSKNDQSVALPVLKRLGVDEYFVFPQINWEPKSQSVADLTLAFNVGMDTVAVIDDSPFERAEIVERCPGVRVYAEDHCLKILDYPEFRPPLSAESSRRREFYRAEEARNFQRAGFHGDYLSFLRACQMYAVVQRTMSDTVARAHELIQRTNQLNFSGNRYDREMVKQLVDEPSLLPLSISCKDRFGDYGLVGFCLIDITAATVTDLMFSCRVQAKRVEHAVLARLMIYLREQGASELRVKYRKTTKNAQAAKVFEDMGFRLIKHEGEQDLHVFKYDLLGEIPQQDVVTVLWEVSG